MIGEKKSLAFLLDCPSKGKYMLFPGYAEDLTKELQQYEEVNTRLEDLTDYDWSAELARETYKVYKRKTKQK